MHYARKVKYVALQRKVLQFDAVSIDNTGGFTPLGAAPQHLKLPNLVFQYTGGVFILYAPSPELFWPLSSRSYIGHIAHPNQHTTNQPTPFLPHCTHLTNLSVVILAQSLPRLSPSFKCGHWMSVASSDP